MSLTWRLISLFVIVLLSTQLSGQGKWQLGIKSGMNFPTTEFGNSDLKTGIGGEMSLGYQFTNLLSAYTGWGWNHFSADQSFAGADVDFEETGYTLGVRFNYPTTISKVTYLVGIGGLYEHIEAENLEGIRIGDTGHGLGVQFEAAVAIGLGRHFQLTPYGRYRSLSTDFSIDNVTTPVDLKYLSAGIGLTYIF